MLMILNRGILHTYLYDFFGFNAVDVVKVMDLKETVSIFNDNIEG